MQNNKHTNMNNNKHNNAHTPGLLSIYYAYYGAQYYDNVPITILIIMLTFYDYHYDHSMPNTMLINYHIIQYHNNYNIIVMTILL